MSDSFTATVRNSDNSATSPEKCRDVGAAKNAAVTKTQVVISALKDRLDRLEQARAVTALAEELDDIAVHCAGLPVLDARPADEIFGYDDQGLPTRWASSAPM